MSAALANLRVLDFSRVLAGPFATMMLADLGATVTKIERPGTGDDTRAWGPPYDERGQATYFQAANRNKDTLTLDLSDPGDRAEARRLALSADVLVENFRPGLMAEFGLDEDQLRPGNPGLIYCSITGFGRGAGAGLPGYDLLVQALGGLMSVTGEPAGEPQKVGVAMVDVLTGLFATTGILTALHHRTRTGEGQRIDVDLLSCLLSALVNQASAYTSGGVVPGRMGNQHPSIAPYEPIPCADGEIVLAVGNDRQFAELCDVVGAPELAADERFATNTARVRHRARLRAELVRLLGARPAAGWVEELTSRRVPAGTVNDVAGAFALATKLGLAPVVELPRADGSTVNLVRNPIGLSVTPPVYRTAPPDLGA
ncbi:CaiB/BaiF CoA transferase family protein [Amycolatopsis pithecellobii]|uniref:CoA transferase n=1 Tax=Amycolatopsis pithecellobii TaxID=664692 RepID=A0A6N7Z3F7_9PSEU|nr:CoA transferase [Amycolatopsis pithecellobii]MTD54761.1 CoA transferase [Amycolatopsis pithecellobii]